LEFLLSLGGCVGEYNTPENTVQNIALARDSDLL
jgi:hypothetical protein